MIPGIHPPPCDIAVGPCRTCNDVAETGRQWPIGARVLGRRGTNVVPERGVIVTGRVPDRDTCPHQLVVDGRLHVAANGHGAVAVLVEWEDGERGWRSPRGLVLSTQDGA